MQPQRDIKDRQTYEGGESTDYPEQGEQALASIASLLNQAQKLLPVLRREFRGEAIKQYPDGSYAYIQVSKPYFVKVNPKTEKPLKRKVQRKVVKGDKNGKPKVEYKTVEIYIPHDEAIEEVLSMLKAMGINQITPLTHLDEQTILDDLREFECKLAGVLTLKQKSWGIDKDMLPTIMSKIKTLVQDARYLSKEGHTLKAIQRTVQRIERYDEANDKKGGWMSNPYNKR